MSDASQGQGWWLASDGKWYPPQQSPIPPPPQPVSVVPVPVWVGFGGALAMFAGSFMPWATAGFLSVSGTDGDGVLTILAAFVVAVSAGMRKAWPMIVAGGLGGAVVGWDFLEVLTASDELVSFSPGIGLFVAGAGAAAACAAGMLLLSQD